MHFESMPFAELLDVVVDNRGRSCPTASAGIPLIATNCIRNEALYPTREKLRYVSLDTYKTWFRDHPQPGDIIVVNKGTPGRVCLVPSPVDFCIAQDMVAVRANSRKIYPKYLFALLRSSDVQARIEQMHVGSLIPHFKKGDFDRLILQVPDVSLQHFVGDAYFALSMKIEINRKASEILESMARALFKSWFVDFEPVRTKSEGCTLAGIDSITAALFPDSLSQSKLGPIPQGWEAASVYDMANVVYGVPFTSSLFNVAGNGLPLLRIRDLSTHWSNVFTPEEHPKARQVNPGDIVVGMDGEFRAHLWSGPISLMNQRVCMFCPLAGVPRLFLALSIEKPLAFFERGKVGTTVIHLGKSDIDTFLLLKPPQEILAAFGRCVEPILERILLNKQQSRNLAELRDTLLPKLISGELRIKDAEKLASSAL